ncbi:MAG: hypothetical protein ABL923_13940 [Burkholderiaceae bacterium]
MVKVKKICHSREGENPRWVTTKAGSWIPACAGMTGFPACAGMTIGRRNVGFGVVAS